MIIVVEGVDGSGKSTLINALRKNPHRQYCLCISASRPWNGISYQRCGALLGLIAELIDPGHVVCDRFHPISELIYASVLRSGEFNLDSIDWQSLLVDVDAIVYCRPPFDVIYRNLSNNPQMNGVKDNISTLSDRYDATMYHIGKVAAVIPYDYTIHSVEPLIERLIT